MINNNGFNMPVPFDEAPANGMMNAGQPSMYDGGGAGSVQALATQTRETARIQSQVFMAKRFPRDYARSIQLIDAACSRLSLAEACAYKYSRGGTEITGASIRLAEELARDRMNMSYGWEVLSETERYADIRCYCDDLESNTHSERQFRVAFVRSTKTGSYPLTDPRDKYELMANQASRRLRACILQLIPSDVVEHALDKCNATLASKVTITPETISNLVGFFKKYRVSRKAIEARIQRDVGALDVRTYIDLRKVAESLSAGVGEPGDFFDMDLKDEDEEKPAPKKARKADKLPQKKAEEKVEQPKQTEPETPAEEPKQTEPETPAEEPKRPVGEKAATVSPTDNGGQGEMFDDDFGGIAF